MVKISQKLPSVFGQHVRHIILTINSGNGVYDFEWTLQFQSDLYNCDGLLCKICLLLKEMFDIMKLRKKI